MRTPSYLSVIVVWLLGVAACSTVGLVTPKTFEETYVAAVMADTTVLQAIPNAMRTHQLTSANAEHLIKVVADAKMAMDEAHEIYKTGNTAGANVKLTYAVTILHAAETLLANKGTP